MKKVLALTLVLMFALTCMANLLPAMAAEQITFFDFRTDPNQPNNEQNARYYEAVKAKWNEMHPDVELVLTGSAAGGTESLGLLQTMLASGTAADVFIHQTRLAAFAQAGYLTDLSDQPWADKIVEGCKPDCIYDDTVYAAPLDSNGWGIYYLKEIYEDELGLKAPANFEEFIANCQVIKDAGYDPIVTGGASGWPFQGMFLSFTSFLFGANPNYHIDLYNGEVSLAGPEMYGLFEAIQELYDKGYFSDATMSYTIEQAREFMGEGKAIMGFGCPGILTPLEEESRGDARVDLGYFYIPDRGGYNCVPVIADIVCSVNAAYDKGSTLGADLISCLVSEEALRAAYDDVSPVGIEGITINYKTTGGQMYQDAFDKGPVMLQATSWLPPSVFDLYQQIGSSIVSGNGFTQEMLDNMEATYRADIQNVNVLQ